MRPRRGLLGAALAIALLPLLAPAAAQAGQLRFTDATHDIVKTDLTDESEPFTPDPQSVNGDIKDVFIHYRKGHLVLRANFVDLRRAKNTLLAFVGSIRTNEKRHYFYDVVTSPGHYAGQDDLVSRRGRRCTIGHMFDYTENFARVSVPLSCLSRPAWVQVKMQALTLVFKNKKALEGATIKPGDLVLRADDALSDTADSTRWTPKVHRG